MKRQRGPLDVLADLLAELSDEELERAYSAAAMSRQTLAEYAWARRQQLREQKELEAIRKAVDPDIQTKEYR